MGRSRKKLSDKPFELEIDSLDAKGLGTAALGEKNLRRVLEKFAQESAKRADSLCAASDCQQIAHEAHTLSSACGSFGLVSLAGELAALEAEAKAGEFAAQDALRHHASRINAGVGALFSALDG